MSRPRLLDLFAGEGGSAYGYHLAGFDVTAVDDKDRPGRAPGVTWVTADATTYPLDGFDVVTGSPPCTDHTTLRTFKAAGQLTGTGWMLTHTLERFREHNARTGVPWVVENVEGARSVMGDALKLCGSMFDLTDGGWLLRRHRYFASDLLLMAPRPCSCHGRKVIGVYGDVDTVQDRVSTSLARREKRPNGDMRASLSRARALMGMPWASGTGLPLAIPPAYTHWIGEQILEYLTAVAA